MRSEGSAFYAGRTRSVAKDGAGHAQDDVKGGFACTQRLLFALTPSRQLLLLVLHHCLPIHDLNVVDVVRQFQFLPVLR